VDTLTTSEHLDGTTAQRRKLRYLLTELRTDPQPAPLPGITFRSLPDVLASELADEHLFSAGYDILSRHCQILGIAAMLPLSRVWVGVAASAPPGTTGSFGGFHHPGQGYRHLQMTATITVYGNLLDAVPAPPQAITLDLLRSYAHDCLHYGTFRRYQLTPTDEPARIQYGINYRRLDGRTYSAADPPSATTTHNLGIVMEGATDSEATAIARHGAETAGLTHMDGPTGVAAWAFLETTGIMSRDDLTAASRSAHPYTCNLSGFARTVTGPYRSLLAELADQPRELHDRIVEAMISGDLTHLERWLEHRHGTGCFATLFRAPTWELSRPTVV
jgi:hypothetical protein